MDGTLAREMCRRAPERGAVGQQDGEVEEAEPAPPRDGPCAHVLLQDDEHAVVVVRSERRVLR
jgi:hypothetical protein